MTKTQWLYGFRYKLSGDKSGLLKYIAPTTFYHIHSKEMGHWEQTVHRILIKLRGKVEFGLGALGRGYQTARSG